MKIAGGILMAVAFLGWLTGAHSPSPGTEPSEALGMSLAPFLFGGLGCFLYFKGEAVEGKRKP